MDYAALGALLAPLGDRTAPLAGGLRSIDRYEVVAQIGEGTYGKVFRGTDRVTGRQVALKKMTPHHEGEGFPRTETREIKTLKSTAHPNMVRLIEVVTSLGSSLEAAPGGGGGGGAAAAAASSSSSSSGGGAAGGGGASTGGGVGGGASATDAASATAQARAQLTTTAAIPGGDHDGRALGQTERSGNIFMVFEYVDYDLAGLLESGYRFEEAQTKSLAYQLLSVLDFLHGRSPPVVHRDLKCANLLLTDDGRLKLGDFGLSRVLAPSNEPMTNNVITLWYRPPELLLGARNYSPAVDMWSVGCILLELITGRPPFPARTEAEQMRNLVSVFGTPPPDSYLRGLPHWEAMAPELEGKKPRLNDYLASKIPRSPELRDLLLRLLEPDPRRRLKASEALASRWFAAEPRVAKDDPTCLLTTTSANATVPGATPVAAPPPASAAGSKGGSVSSSAGTVRHRLLPVSANATFQPNVDMHEFTARERRREKDAKRKVAAAAAAAGEEGAASAADRPSQDAAAAAAASQSQSQSQSQPSSQAVGGAVLDGPVSIQLPQQQPQLQPQPLPLLAAQSSFGRAPSGPPMPPLVYPRAQGLRVEADRALSGADFPPPPPGCPDVTTFYVETRRARAAHVASHMGMGIKAEMADRARPPPPSERAERDELLAEMMRQQERAARIAAAPDALIGEILVGGGVDAEGGAGSGPGRGPLLPAGVAPAGFQGGDGRRVSGGVPFAPPSNQYQQPFPLQQQQQPPRFQQQPPMHAGGPQPPFGGPPAGPGHHGYGGSVGVGDGGYPPVAPFDQSTSHPSAKRARYEPPPPPPPGPDGAPVMMAPPHHQQQQQHGGDGYYDGGGAPPLPPGAAAAGGYLQPPPPYQQQQQPQQQSYGGRMQPHQQHHHQQQPFGAYPPAQQQQLPLLPRGSPPGPPQQYGGPQQHQQPPPGPPGGPPFGAGGPRPMGPRSGGHPGGYGGPRGW